MPFNYRDLLKTEFDRRRSVNHSYSLRAFARDTGLSAPHLSAVFSGRKGISPAKAHAIASVLGLSLQDEQQFVSDVAARHGRSSAEKNIAQDRLRKISSLNPQNYRVLQEAQFRVISDWYHVAILQLTETVGFKWSPRFIASRLGISAEKVSTALRALVTAKMLKKNGAEFTATDEFIRTEDVPSKAIRISHLQFISKAAEALEEQPFNERDFASLTVAIDPKRLPEFKAYLNEFREKFCAEANIGSEKSEVYNLSMQFFRLTKPNQEIGENT